MARLCHPAPAPVCQAGAQVQEALALAPGRTLLPLVSRGHPPLLADQRAHPFRKGGLR